MLISAGGAQALLDLNAHLWVMARYPKAFAEHSAFWVIYSDPDKRERLGSAVTRKGAWIDAYHKMKAVTEE